MTVAKADGEFPFKTVAQMREHLKVGRSTPKEESNENYGSWTPKTLATQLQKANAHVSKLAAQVRALGGEPIGFDSPFDALSLLEQVALTFAEAAEAAQAAQSIPLDPTGHHIPHPNDRAAPGGSTARVRRAIRRMENAIQEALNEFDEKKERNFLSLKPGEKGYVPRVRCGTRGCKRYDEKVPAWDSKGANEFCRSCGARFSSPSVDGSGRQ